MTLKAAAQYADRFSPQDRVLQRDYPRVLGTVRACSDDVVVVEWDNGQVGHLVWSYDVCYSAFRLDSVGIDLEDGTRRI